MNAPFLEKLCQNYTEEEIIEIKSYLSEWSAATYLSIAHNILDHADRKQIDPLKLLRKAHNFNKKRATRIPPKDYRQDQSAVYRKNNDTSLYALIPLGLKK
jgi:hypothetical protein